MTWNELRELRRHEISVGSHTVNHPELHRMTPTAVEEEIRQSKDTIEDRLGEPICSFSYPFAFPERDKGFTMTLQGLLEKHGYENGVSTIIGTATGESSRFFLPRLPVNSYDDLRLFEAKLEGSYNWLHGPQYLFKTLKTVLPKYQRTTNLN